MGRVEQKALVNWWIYAQPGRIIIGLTQASNVNSSRLFCYMTETAGTFSERPNCTLKDLKNPEITIEMSPSTQISLS